MTNLMPIGIVIFANAGVAQYSGVIHQASTTTGLLRVFNPASTYVTQSAISATIPFTWGTSDIIEVLFSYLA